MCVRRSRYYGESMPYAPNTPGCLNFLTSEQAMADFAYLIDHLRTSWGAAKSAFLGFGGSYGGMLGSWFRVHYPNAIDGVVAASASMSDHGLPYVAPYEMARPLPIDVPVALKPPPKPLSGGQVSPRHPPGSIQ